MLFYEDFLEGVKAGKFTLAFRRWNRARVKTGTRLRTQLGVVEVLEVDPIDDADVSDQEAKLAGYKNREKLIEELSGRQDSFFAWS